MCIRDRPLAYNKDFQEDKEAIFDSVKTVRDSLIATSILFEEGLIFRKEKLNDAVFSDFSNATDVADYLVAKEIPFREAYQLVGRIVKTSLEEGILLKDIPLERWKSFHKYFEEDIYQKLLPSSVVESRLSHGGTGFERVQEQLLLWREKLFK